MTIRRAVSLLRKKSGLDQAAFAEQAGTTIETVSRWENGRRAPNSETLLQLASIAALKGQPELSAVFESKWKDRIASRRKHLPSAGTQRRLSVDDLKYIAAVARNVHDDLENTLRRVWREIPKAEDLYPWLIASLQSNALHYLGRVLEEVELHIDEPYGLTRAEEDKKLLLRRATSTYGLQATPRPKDGGR